MSPMPPEKPEPKRKKQDFSIATMAEQVADMQRLLPTLADYLKEAAAEGITSLHFEGGNVERSLKGLRSIRKSLPDAIDDARKLLPKKRKP